MKKTEKKRVSNRVIRGNGWYDNTQKAPIAFTPDYFTPVFRNCFLGFRLVEEVGSTDSWSPRPHRGSVSFSYTNYAQNSICLMADPNRSGTGVGIRLVEEVADE